MDTKRGHERKDLKVYLKVLDEKTNKLFGYLVDITMEGIMVTGEQAVETDTDFQLSLVLPKEIDGKNEFSFSAKSRWSEKDSESDFYNTGLQFINLPPGDAQIIEQMIQDYCFETDDEEA